jgi:two-component system chemotaxis sensor kinase CheA
MAESTHLESVNIEIRQLLDELAVRSMTEMDVVAEEAQTICERFAAIQHLAAEADYREVAKVAETLQSTLAKTPESSFISALRDAVSKVQDCMDGSGGEPAGFTDSSSGSDSPSIVDPGLVADFIVESREHLAASEDRTLALEKTPEDVEVINAIFRVFHSIKGLAAFLEFDRVYRFAHEVETLLDYARNRELTITPEVIDLILASADFLSRCIDAIESGPRGLDSLPDTEGALVQRILQTIEDRNKNTEDTQPSPIPVTTETAVAVAPPAEVATNPLAPEETAMVAARSVVLSSETTQTAPAPAAGTDLATTESKNNGERYSIRVDTSKLDYLMDMVGELVIAESLVRTEITEQSQSNTALIRTIAQLAQITSEVQRTTFRMRMVPIGHLMRRTGRIVRDLARKFGKKVEVEFEGEETEVDKTIVEELADPLMHIVRNAIDHGIEMPAERAALGKSDLASIRFTAVHEGSQIVVEVSDDGRGLDRAKILKKAREQKLISDSADLSDAAVMELIFNPGFSTADKVTTVSGRGVGMDVVRRHVEKLRGRVDVQSKPGGGTKFTIRLPLTRAIIDGLVVKVGNARYVIPMSSVREIFRPAESAVSTVHGKGKLVLLHDRLLPIFNLSREFGVESTIVNPWDAVLIVTQSEGRQVCLMVDELVGKQEVVVKGLGQCLKDIPGVSGGTILGDGRVGLILEVQQLEGKM